MNKKEELFWDIIEILFKNNILGYIILIGSWVEYIYEAANYFHGFEANLKTKDVDFLIKNISKPRERIKLVEILENEDYLLDKDYLSGVYKFYKDRNLEVEFIARELGKGKSEPYKVDSLGIKVEGLRNMDVLINNSTTLIVKNFPISVPIPQSYILHKMIIYKERTKKAERDFLSIDNILGQIKKSKTEVEVLKGIYGSLSKKQKNLIDYYCKLNFIKL